VTPDGADAHPSLAGSFADAGERIPLRGRPDGIVLGPEGFHHPRGARGRAQCFTRYADLTHLGVSDRHVWIATRGAMTVLPRSLFAVREDAPRLVDRLLRRVAEAPDGRRRIARMAALDALARHPAPPRATWTLATLCVLGFLLEAWSGADVSTAGYFSPLLVADGDTWRLITANLLHGFGLHLLVNLVGLLVVGRLLERLLGTVRTIGVMGMAALGSMLASGAFLPGPVVGVSGVVFGLAGAVLWLELRHPAEIPAWWRFPRVLLRLVLIAFAVDVALGFLVPFIAGEAHLGGFLAGIVGAALLTRPGSLGPQASPPARVLAAAVLALTVLAVGRAAFEVVREPDYSARHATRIAGLAGISPFELNNHAWLIAIDPDASPAQMEAALMLAERAVLETDSLEATVLDTLAEVQFQLGRGDLAVATIDKAIDREPQEPYYREQRRRFTGERSRDDRPEDPALRLPGTTRPPLPPDDDGLSV